MHNTIEGSELLKLRKTTEYSQADVAKKMRVDQSRISRLESDSKVSVEEAKIYLLALDDCEAAKEFIKYIDSKWEFIAKPEFNHPCREVLRMADDALLKLKNFLSDPNNPSDLVQQAKIYEDVLDQSARYLGNLKHGIAFVGNISVGKTTALCWLINLLIEDAKSLKQRAVLETGAGWVTLGTVRISALDSSKKGGEIGRFGIVIQPYSSEEIFRLANDLCASCIAIHNGQETESRITEEIERALRSMAGLTRKPQKDAESPVEDPLDNLAAMHRTSEKLTAEFVSLLKLNQRLTTDLWFDAPTKQDGLKWLQTEFRRINNGRNPAISLPKHIDVFVPYKLIEKSPFDLEFTDTKGAEGTATRPDIQTHLDDARSLTVLCSRFAPDNTMFDLLEHLTATGKASTISERILFLVLPRPEEAMALDKESGEPVDSAQEAYKIREAQIRTKLARFPGGQMLPILFYNASEESSAEIINCIHKKLSFIRSIQESRIQVACAALNGLVSKQQREKTQKAFAKLRAALTPIIKEYSRLPSRTIPVYDRMLAALRNSHPKTVWASARRNGDWTMLDSYHYVGVGANMDAFKRTEKAMDAVLAMIDHLSADPECVIIKNHLMVLKDDVLTWRLKYLEEVSRHAKEIVRAVLFPDYKPWADGLAYWGKGKGFRDKIAENILAWLKDDHREWMEVAVEGIILKNWQEKILAQLELLAKDPHP